MHPEAHALLNPVIVQHPQGAKMHPVGIVVIGKTEGMPGFQPTMIGMSSASSFV
jgi:hypothetical protein